jgi:hypothetical protein
MGLDTVGELDGDMDGQDVVGALVRAASGRGGMRPRGGPLWLKSASKQGVSRASEELDYLPFVTTTLTSAVGSGNGTAFPQRPFRGERPIFAAAYITAAGVVTNVSDFVVITPAMYVGAVQVGSSQGDAPLSAWTANAFGVRLSFPSAGQGTRVFIPYAAIIPIAAGDKIVVTMTIMGRAVR